MYSYLTYFHKHTVSHEDIIRGKINQAVKDVIYEVASLSHRHLETVRSLLHKIC